MEREKWAEVIHGFGWLCFRCQQGHLRFDHKLFQQRETADSTAVGRDRYNIQEYSESRFTALIVCDNPDCRDPVAVSGLYSSEHDQIGEDEYESTYYYNVLAVNPPPAPFRIPPQVPTDVSQHIRAAASLLWTDHDAAANKIRQCVEALLDERGVKKYPKTGPRRAIALDHRIRDYGAQKEDTARLLMAIKWIGNAGSHGDGISRDDVLDALEIMEHVFDEVYVGHRAKMLAKVTKIVARKKPLPKRR